MAGNEFLLLSGSAHPALAGALAGQLGQAPSECTVERFADGEVRVSLPAEVAGRTAVLVQPLAPEVHGHLMELLLMADAAKACGARRVVAVLPYVAYARQERRAQPGQPRSAQMLARLLEAAQLDELILLEPHVPALESVFRMPATVLDADAVLLEALRRWDLPQPVIVSPDAGGLKRAQRLADALAAPLGVIAKWRPSADQAAMRGVLGEVRDRTCVLVDDLASTGRTLCAAAEALRTAGAAEVHAAFVHAVMAPGTLQRLAAAPLERLLTTDSLPAPQHSRLEVVSVVRLLAEALRRRLDA